MAAIHESDEEVLDKHALEAIRSLEQSGSSTSNLLCKVINLYLENSQQLLTTILQSVQNDVNDLETIRSAAHSLKSSSFNVGAARVGELCKTLETNIRNSETTNITALVPQIELEHQRACEALERERRSNQS